MRGGFVYHPDFLLHNRSDHPENKERLEAVIELLRAEKLTERLVHVLPRPAEPAEIEMVHTPNYIKNIRELCEKKQSYVDPDTYLAPQSYEIAKLSAGGALAAMRSVLCGDLDVCFSLGRPPGHHAEPHQAMGFCLFNNIAIAARAAQQEFDLSRILILDFDVHHGNGTQKVFYHDPGVLYISIHQNPAFPNTGYYHETGEGLGTGYNVNVPLPPGCGDEEYELVMQQIVSPVTERYQPELVMVSAGFDIYHKEPLASMNVSFRGFANLARHIREIAQKYCEGKTVLCLEGGYHPQGQAEAVATILSELCDLHRPINPESAPPSDPLYDDPCRVIDEVRQIHKL